VVAARWRRLPALRPAFAGRGLGPAPWFLTASTDQRPAAQLVESYAWGPDAHRGREPADGALSCDGDGVLTGARRDASIRR
jgi:hypothetical protein